jgi:hypothetical protein
MAQAANVLHDAFEEPGRVLWRKVGDRGRPFVRLAMQWPWTVCLTASRCGSGWLGQLDGCTAHKWQCAFMQVRRHVPALLTLQGFAKLHFS